MSFFPGDLEAARPLKNSEKELSRNYFRNDFVSEGTKANVICLSLKVN